MLTLRFVSGDRRGFELKIFEGLMLAHQNGIEVRSKT